MEDRVVYCTPATWEALAPWSPIELGANQAGDCWATLASAALIEARGAGVAPPILYFSADEYEGAMRDLGQEQVEEAIALRRATFSPRALGEGTTRLYELEREALVLAAQAAQTRGARHAQLFDDALWRMARLTGQLRFDDTPVSSLALYTFERDSQLHAEAQTEPAPAADVAAVMATSRRHAATYGQLLAHLGRTDFPGNLIFVDVRRTVFIHPEDASLKAWMHEMHIPHFAWKGRVVAPWPARKIAGLTAQGKTVEVLYPSPGGLTLATSGQTGAQRDRDLTARRELAQTSAAALRLAHWNDLRVALALLRRNLLDRCRKEVPAYVPVVEAQVQEETASLRWALATAPSWVSPGAALDPLLDQLYRESTFFTALAALEGDETLRDELNAHTWLLSSSITALRAR